MREVTLRIESNENAPSASRSHLVPMKPDLGASYDDVVLLVSELVTNSVRHSDSEDIDVSVVANDSKVRVEVTDEGPGFARDTPRGDGMGLQIVERVSESWGMHNHERFTVWAELARS
jgi:signal transduction histidine kinase